MSAPASPRGSPEPSRRSWCCSTISATGRPKSITSRMSKPDAGCCLMRLNSTSLSRPGLARISAGTAILPMSWMRPPRRRAVSSSPSMPMSSAMAVASSATRRSCPAVYGSRVSTTWLMASTAPSTVRRSCSAWRRTVEGAVLAMSHVVETRDPYTAGHERRVAELATAIAEDMGMDGEELTALRLGGLIHDIGKIAVPAEILAKPGRLSEVEFNLIKQHPASSFDILEVIDFGRPVAEIVLQHHERLDGSGYPRGLAGADILPAARILAVADVVEAMSSHRPYRAALGMEAALAEI